MKTSAARPPNLAEPSHSHLSSAHKGRRDRRIAASDEPSEETRIRGAEPARLNVLVVEDQPFHCAVAQTILGLFGCAVSDAPNGAAALVACAARTFDLVVVARRLPGLSGDETVRRLRAQEGPCRGAFVACYTNDPPNDLSAGYDVVTPKPLTGHAAEELLVLAAARRRRRESPRVP